MAYVDLNPIRAGIADSIESSDFTSIQERLFDIAHSKIKARIAKRTELTPQQSKLLPFVEAEHQNSSASTLPFNLKDYLDLVDFTGRIVREVAHGFLPPATYHTSCT